MRMGKGATYENALNIYTDGSSLGHPRRGGLAARFVIIDEHGHERMRDLDFVGYDGATNNQMELLAVVRALQEAARSSEIQLVQRIVVFSDSRYVVDNWRTATFSWSRNGWLNRSGRPVENADLWREFLKAIRALRERHRLPVEVQWVKAHKSNPHNKMVDKLAKRSAQGLRNPPRVCVRVRRKKTSALTVVGSVEMKGQRLTIRIIEDRYLPLQKLSRYRYEVTSPRSNYAGLVDIVFSEYAMWAGHTYEVRFNRTTQNPRVVKVLREITVENAEVGHEEPSVSEPA